MRSERRAVLSRDLSLAGIMVVAGLFGGGVPAVRAVPVVATTIGVLIAIAAYAGEHDLVPGLFPEVATMTTFAVAILVGVAFVVLLSAPTDVVAAAGLTGGGIGYGLYRIIFGVIRPVPSYRLETGRDVDPGAPDSEEP